MGLFEKLKSLLGLESDGESTTDDRDVGITVERERGEGTASTRRHDADDEAGDTGGAAGSTPAGPAGGVSASDAAATTGSESDTATASGAAPTPDSAAESTDTDTDTDDDGRRVPSEAVDVIKGIGPTYAGRLSGAGIETVDDLAAADAADVADRADVPEGRLEDWIERAQNRAR